MTKATISNTDIVLASRAPRTVISTLGGHVIIVERQVDGLWGYTVHGPDRSSGTSVYGLTTRFRAINLATQTADRDLGGVAWVNDG